MIKLLSVLSAAGVLTIGSCQTTSPSNSETRPVGQTVLNREDLQDALTGKVDFVQHVKPILEAKCAMCHNHEALPWRMSLSSRASAVQTGALGAFIVPGQPDRSLLVTKIGSTAAHGNAMPPVGERITRDEVSVLRRWIQQGAPWPSGAAGRLNTQG